MQLTWKLKVLLTTGPGINGIALAFKIGLLVYVAPPEPIARSAVDSIPRYLHVCGRHSLYL